MTRVVRQLHVPHLQRLGKPCIYACVRPAHHPTCRQRTQTRKFSIEGADAPAAEAAAAAQKPRAASHDDEDEDEDVGGSGGGSEHEDGKENARGDMQADEEERQYEVNQLVCANWQKNGGWSMNPEPLRLMIPHCFTISCS